MNIFSKTLLISPFLLGTALAQSGTKPNIVFILADDMGWGDISCHGHQRFRTPNIDALATNGIDFHQFYVANPISSPSRCGMLTGSFPIRYGIHMQLEMALNYKNNQVDWLDPNAPTIAKALQTGGYETAHFGKWHLVEEASATGCAADAPRVEAYGFDVAEPMRGPWPGLGSTIPQTTIRTVYDRAVNYINTTHSKPFYVQVWTHEPHVPIGPTTAGLNANLHITDERERKYAGVITDEDNGVGRIIAALKDQGLYENTIVVFASDNGPAVRSDVIGNQNYYNFGTTGGRRGTKGTLYEGGVRTPLIVSWPAALPKGKVDKTTQIAGIDLFPTLCALTNTQLPNNFTPDGENMKSACEGSAVQRTKPLFWYYSKKYAVINGENKLITDESYSATTMEMYDLKNDTAEAINIRTSKPEIVTSLKQLIIDYRTTLPTSLNQACFSVYRPATAFNNLSNNIVQVTTSKGKLEITGFEIGKKLTIIDLSGREIQIKDSVSNTTAFSLKSGFYIIKELNRKIIIS